MPARSEKQRKATGAALSIKQGKRAKKNFYGASKKMVESMNEKELRDFAKKS